MLVRISLVFVTLMSIAFAKSNFRMLVEKFEYLQPAQVANLIYSCSKSDLQTLSIYPAFAALVHIQTCQVKPNTVMYYGGQNINCPTAMQNWQNTLYFMGGNVNAAAEYGMSQRNQLLIQLKCATGEIDKGSCQMYLKGKSNYNNAINSTNKNIIDNMNPNCPAGYYYQNGYCYPR